MEKPQTGTVVGYIRVSTREQAETRLSLTHQEEKIRAFASARDLVLSKVYNDASESAKDLNRPAITQLLAEIDRRRISHVIIYKLDRLTRSVRDLAALLELFDKRKVALMAVQDSLDTSSASGRLVINVMGSVAQWERETISERTKAALDVKRRRGERLGGFVPYGWTSRRGALVAIPAEQEVVRWIVASRDKSPGGLGYKQIAEELNERGVRPRNGRKWYASTVRGICIRLSKPGVNGLK